MQNEVVIKRHILGTLLLILGCLAFVVACVFILRSESENEVLRFFAIVGIVFFGGGGLVYAVVMSWKPIVVISRDGITIPFGWGKNFISWENVDRIEVIEQTVDAGRGGVVRQKYIGVSVFDRGGIVGAGETSKAVAQEITNWKEVPAVLINLSFSFAKIEDVMKTLQDFHDEYKNAESTQA